MNQPASFAVQLNGARGVIDAKVHTPAGVVEECYVSELDSGEGTWAHHGDTVRTPWGHRGDTVSVDVGLWAQDTETCDVGTWGLRTWGHGVWGQSDTGTWGHRLQ